MNPAISYFLKLVNVGVFSIEDDGSIYLRYHRQYRRSCRQKIVHIQRNGYMTVSFHYKEKRYYILNHQAVYCHFHGDIPDGLQINHIDGCKTNNHPDNLEAVSPKENVLHSFNVSHTRNNYGENYHSVRLKRSQVGAVLYYRWRKKYTLKQLSEKFGVSIGCISHVLAFRSWKWMYRKNNEIV